MELVKRNARNGEIDVLRFVFCIVIVLLHLTHDICPQGNISVEFFFALSGLLMARHAEKIADNKTLSLDRIADETWIFIKVKVRSFYRYYLCALFLLIVVKDILLQHMDAAAVITKLLSSVTTFSLTFFALNYDTVAFYVGATWYLSAMLIAMFLLYPILLKHYRFSLMIVFPILAVFLLGYEQAVNGDISVWKPWAGITRFGILRAIADISFGAVLYCFSTILTQKRSQGARFDNPLIKLALTLVKLVCYAVAIVFAHGEGFGLVLERDFQLHCLILLGIGLLLTYSGLGYCIPDGKAARFLGRISLPIFIFHRTLSQIWFAILHTESLSDRHRAFLVVMCVVGSVCLMFAVDALSNVLKQRRSARAA